MGCVAEVHCLLKMVGALCRWKGRTQYCQCLSTVPNAVFGLAFGLRAACQFSLVKQKVEINQALPSCHPLSHPLWVRESSQTQGQAVKEGCVCLTGTHYRLNHLEPWGISHMPNRTYRRRSGGCPTCIFPCLPPF